ncbi:UNVERIFIED_CONTAM: hypothetical protein GTU68_059842 [Idotea baltica]|nr:hypothetical protein [Idotea baltica]
MHGSQRRRRSSIYLRNHT